LPLIASQNYDFVIEWGDGTIEEYLGQYTEISHNYANEGEYNISIKELQIGGFAGIFFSRSGDATKVLDLVQWGGNTWLSLESAFYGCSNMIISATDHLTAKTENVEYFTNAWRDCSSIVSFPAINTSNGINFTNAWRGCTSMTDFGDINVSKGATFSGTWRACSAIYNFPELDMASMTNGQNCFNGVELWENTYSVILQKLANNNLNEGVYFHAGSSKYYSSSQSYKDTLLGRNWNIIDGGMI
jgi:hypothetical protein